jgi:hypothetical protein
MSLTARELERLREEVTDRKKARSRLPGPCMLVME